MRWYIKFHGPGNFFYWHTTSYVKHADAMRIATNKMRQKNHANDVRKALVVQRSFKLGEW